MLAQVIVVLWILQSVSSQDCSSCLQSICGSEQQQQCRLVQSTELDCVQTNCSDEAGLDNIIECSNSTGQRLLVLDSEEVRTENCATNRATSGDSTSALHPGFYIITDNIRFCSSQCIGRVLMGSTTPMEPTLQNPIRFYVYKRYIRRLGADDNDIYVEQQSFDVNLAYNGNERFYEATPTSSVCVDEGDYIGFTLNEDIGLDGTIVGGTGGAHFNSPRIGCSSSITGPIYDVDRFDNLITTLPLISFEPAQEMTTTGSKAPSSTSTMQSSGSTGSSTDIETTSTSSLADTSALPTSFPPGLIVGAAVAGVIVIAVLITIIVVVILCLVFAGNNKLSYYPSQSFAGGTSETISMNTFNSEYMENHNFKLPPQLQGVETVENPAAECETPDTHDYHEPFEMNAAQARSRQLPPRPTMHLPLETTVPNLHYGSQMLAMGNGHAQMSQPAGDPHYQSPDELASTPQIQRKKTFKNPLYSTTGDIRSEALEHKMQIQVMNSEAVPIYDQPTELNTQIPMNVTQPSASTGALNIYNDEVDHRLKKTPSIEISPADTFGQQYTMPIHTTMARNSASFLPNDPVPSGHQYYELEPNAEVMETTGHHYHLLDSQRDLSDDDDSHRGSLLKSTVHHVVNEQGAYVPSAEERKELFSGKNTLSVETYESWTKTSFKEKKFFVKSEEFWVPSKNEKNLYNQLNQKKFREIVKEQLHFEKHLGQGQFGSVQKATWNYGGVSKDVAVKIMKPSALEDSKVKFLQEAAIMGQFFHSNVTKLYGLVTMNNPVMIVMEFMQLGDLLSYLIKHYRPIGVTPPRPETLLSFCRQIACGMKYLARKHFVHRDLAARNIFVSETLVCKIGDFGMSRNLLEEEYYISHGGVVPVKWTAPEGLNYKKYSTASDVYSYGMTLYEIWSLGEKPLKDIPQEKVARVMSNGYCQPPPPGTPRKLYHIMVQCWNPAYAKRPNFDELFEFLNSSDSELLGWLENDESTIAESPLSKVIGSEMDNGHCLYKDLQATYHGITPDNINRQFGSM